jgi:hypothetical protein
MFSGFESSYGASGLSEFITALAVELFVNAEASDSAIRTLAPNNAPPARKPLRLVT